ncbi:rni-like superfamily protein [Anaeramoeba flamelloides]|uniref:Rni-like superfamily protein n=1 Tax=Anaeramoeba flamelloides TaxID=1746091 RepID=A0AAV8AA07_9EUKA|nr:rni-like superfamily protein [Anaeramoeba flamelloides]
MYFYHYPHKATSTSENKISDIVNKMHFLSDLYINTPIATQEVELFCDVFERNKSLTSLWLKGNTTPRPEDFDAFCRSLARNRTITFLSIEGMDLRLQGWKSLGEALVASRNIECLILKENGLNVKRASVLFKSFAQNKNLKRLCVSNNKIGSKSIEDVAFFLKENSSVEDFDISYNTIGYKGSTEIGESLRTNHTLIKLNLTNTHVTDSAARSISQALQSNHTLIDLDLGENEIGNKGATEIGKTLAANHSLIKLCVYQNNIKAAGIVKIAKGLEQNSTLTSLGLGDNTITKRAATAISAMLEINKRITEINMVDQDDGIERRVPRSLLLKIEYEQIHRNRKIGALFIDLIKNGDLQTIQRHSDILNFNHQEKEYIVITSSTYNTPLHIALLQRQTQILKFLLLNTKVNKRFCMSIRNMKGLSPTDLLHSETLLIEDFTTMFHQIIAQWQKLSTLWPRSRIAEEEIILMRTGLSLKDLKTPLGRFSQGKKLLFVKWLYCPHEIQATNEKLALYQILVEIGIQKLQEKMVFPKRSLIVDFQNYVEKYQHSKSKNVLIETKQLQDVKIPINKFILCLRCGLYRKLFLNSEQPVKTITDYLNPPELFYTLFCNELYCKDFDRSENKEKMAKLVSFFQKEDVWDFYQVNSKLFFLKLYQLMK